MKIKLISLLALVAILSLTGFKKAPSEEVGVNWVTLEQAQELQKTEPRPILIDVYTTWCGPCKKMSKTTFADESIVEYINSKYYAVKFDAESNETIRFKEEDYKSPRRTHSFANYLKISGYPSSVFMNEKLETLANVPGYLSKKEYLPLLKFFGDGHYKTTKWVDYLKTI